MKIAEITIRVSKETLSIAEAHAQAQGISVDELIARFLRSLRSAGGAIHPEVAKISGLIPSCDAREEYRAGVLHKHGLSLRSEMGVGELVC
jgi:uncharacterized protein DUF6364